MRGSYAVPVASQRLAKALSQSQSHSPRTNAIAMMAANSIAERFSPLPFMAPVNTDLRCIASSISPKLRVRQETHMALDILSECSHEGLSAKLVGAAALVPSIDVCGDR